MPALPRLYAHPFSSYSQKALIALYENRTAFDYRNLEDARANEELAALWPMRRFPVLVADARTMLETAYAWLDRHMAKREWAAGAAFSLADCGAAPFLFYADWTHPIDPGFTHVRAYRERLLARPSFKRAVDEARPYRSYFPLGAPDRD